MLGEKIYPMIERLYPGEAGKITGMLLEMDNSELLMMLEQHDILKAKVPFRTNAALLIVDEIREYCFAQSRTCCETVRSIFSDSVLDA